MKNKNSILEMFINAGILFAITLLAGLALGFVNELTKEPIAYQQELKIQKACAAVFAEADSFEVVTQDGATTDESVNIDGVKIGEVYRALAGDGSLLGYVINTTSPEGYGGDISLMMGVKMDGTLNGISILEIAETPGLGMLAEDVLVPQYANKNVETFTYTKSGAMNESEIDAISGATVTTEAVNNAVNAGLSYFIEVLQEGGN